jgi:hypothetical protein
VVTSFTITFINKNFYIQPRECVNMFCVVLRTNSNYFPTQYWHVNINNQHGVFTERYELNLQRQFRLILNFKPRGSTFGTIPFHMRFLLDKVALRKIFLQVLRFSLSVSFRHCTMPILNYSPQNDKRAKSKNLLTINALSENRVTVDRKSSTLSLMVFTNYRHLLHTFHVSIHDPDCFLLQRQRHTHTHVSQA